MSETIETKFVRLDPPVNVGRQTFEIGQERTAVGVDKDGTNYTRVVDVVPVAESKQKFLDQQQEALQQIQAIIDEVSVL